MNEENYTDQPETGNEMSAEPSKAATNENIYQAIRKIQDHMKFLEKKLDWLLERSNGRKQGGGDFSGGGRRGGFGGGDRSGRPFRRDRHERNDRNDRRGGRPRFGDRHDRPERHNRPERHERIERPESSNREVDDNIGNQASGNYSPRPKGNRQMLGEWKLDGFNEGGHKGRRHH